MSRGFGRCVQVVPKILWSFVVIAVESLFRSSMLPYRYRRHETQRILCVFFALLECACSRLELPLARGERPMCSRVLRGGCCLMGGGRHAILVTGLKSRSYMVRLDGQRATRGKTDRCRECHRHSPPLLSCDAPGKERVCSRRRRLPRSHCNMPIARASQCARGAELFLAGCEQLTCVRDHP